MKHNRIPRVRMLALVSLIVLIALASVGTTVAYLFMKTGTVTNTFQPVEVSVEVEEKIDGAVKKDVKVTNTTTADVPVYIRAAVVVTWQKSDGTVYGTAPVLSTGEVAGDYTMTMSNSDKWFEENGFWYYTDKVAKGASTENLIESCRLEAEAARPDGYNLTVEILAQAIQANPADAVVTAWGNDVKVDSNGNLAAKQ